MENKTDNFSVCIVGGSFDGARGKPSSLIDKIYARVESHGHIVQCFNGGDADALVPLLDVAGKHDVVFWFARVPNSYAKCVTDLKKRYPKVLLVTSKRNDNHKYSFGELVNRALGLKSNLVMEFYKFGNRFQGRVFDPLGCVWAHSEDFDNLTDAVLARIKELRTFTREGSMCLGGATEVPYRDDLGAFYEIIKSNAKTFHDLIHPADGVERFLGNASFRCERGFPSFRSQGDIYVSRRNVDKRFVGPDAFVQVELIEEGVGYYGGFKPSVDTPVQLRLYAHFPKIKYMLHAHTYIVGAPFTRRAISCGAVEEFDEIVGSVAKGIGYTFIALNLVGHGSIVLAADVEDLRGVKYYARNVPEKCF